MISTVLPNPLPSDTLAATYTSPLPLTDADTVPVTSQHKPTLPVNTQLRASSPPVNSLSSDPTAAGRYLNSTRSLEYILNRNIKLTSKTNSLRIIVSIIELLHAFKMAFSHYEIDLIDHGAIRLIGSTATAILLEQEQTTAAHSNPNQTSIPLAPTPNVSIPNPNSPIDNNPTEISIPTTTSSGTSHNNITPVNSCHTDDLDFVFRLQKEENFSRIREIQELALCGLFKKKRNISLSPYDCYNMFFHASFCIDKKPDKWSLISLGSMETTVDIKVLYSCSRMYAFSIDSFEIDLDPLILNYYPKNHKVRLSRRTPTLIQVYSNYPNFDEAIRHLQNRLISTDNIGEIHHGLFRYCLELARGYQLDTALSEKTLIQTFWIEYEQIGLSGLKMTIAKFVAKHRKHWFSILSNMYDVIQRNVHENDSSGDVLEVILKFLFRKN